MFSCEYVCKNIIRILTPGSAYVYLAIGREKAMLIDTGYGVYGLKEFVCSLTDKEIICVVTHGHADHCGGVGSFDNVFINQADISLSSISNFNIRNDAALFKSQHINARIIESITPKLGYTELHDNDIINLGGITVKFHSLPGHTSGILCPEFVEKQLLLLGDACSSSTFLQLPESLTVEGYLSSLESFRDSISYFDGDFLYSHPLNSGNRFIIDEMIDLCKDIVNGNLTGISIPSRFATDVCIAKKNGRNHLRLDGKQANLFFLQSRIYDS